MDRMSSTRAAALPPEQRREAIVDSTIPLLIAHGSAVTTRQIAEAAGIAEGTIFRVFPDKDSLIDAVIERVFDPDPVDSAIRAIDRTLPLEARLVAAVEIVQARIRNIWKLMSAVGVNKVPDRDAEDSGQRQVDLTSLAELFDPDQQSLTRDPITAAGLLYGLAFAACHPMIATPSLSAADVVSVILDGLRGPATNP